MAIRVAVAAALLPATLGAQDPALPLATFPERAVRALAPGVEHTHMRAAGTSEAAPWSAHMLRIDLSLNRIDIALAMDQILGQETVSSLVTRRGALAGVNGGFSVSNDPWNPIHGDPNGFLMIDGEVLSEPVEDRPALGFCGGSSGQYVVTARPTVRVDVHGTGSDWLGWSLNRARSEDDIVVYTPRWGPTTLTVPGGLEVVVRDGRVEAVLAGGSASIPENGFVLSVSGRHVASARERYPIGGMVTHTVVVTDEEGEPLPVGACSYTSAGPVIATGGAVRTDYAGEAYRDGFVVDRHPRTAVGVAADGRALILFTIDGRQEGHSAGATLVELAELLVAEGASMVYNLDGGGSTTMATAGEGVINRPSDGTERRRCDALLVFPAG